MVAEGQNGIFQKTPFLPSQTSKTVMALIAKIDDEGQNDFLAFRLLTAFLAGNHQNDNYQKTPFLPSQARKAVKALIPKM